MARGSKKKKAINAPAVTPVTAAAIAPQVPAPPIVPISVPINRHDLWLALAVAGLTLIVYIMTLAPTVTGEDSGELIAAAYTTGVAHPPGYPLWCLLTKPFFLIPYGDMAWRANFASAFWGALTVAGVFLLARCYGTGRPAAWLAALALAFSQRFWSQCVITEVYPLNVFFFVLLLHTLESLRMRHGMDRSTGTDGADGNEGEQSFSRVSEQGNSAVSVRQSVSTNRKCLGNYALPILGLVFGLALANHYMLTLLVTPGLAILFFQNPRRLMKRWKHLLAAIGLGCLALLVYLYLPLAASRAPFLNWGDPSTWERLWNHILRVSYRSLELSQAVGLDTKWLFIQQAAGELWHQFTPWLLLFLVLGLISLWKRDRRLTFATISIFLLNTVVLILILHFSFERENRQRMEPYYLPAWTVAALWIGLGADAILRFLQRRWTSASLSTSSTALHVATGIVVLLPFVPWLSYFTENDQHRFRIARDYAEAILQTAEPNAILFPSADYSTFPLVYLMAVEGKRPDILLADITGLPRENKGTRALYESLVPANERQPLEGLSAPQFVQIFARQSGRPVYLTDRTVSPPPPGMKVIPCGVLYKVVPQTAVLQAAADPWNRIVIPNVPLAAQSSDSMERGIAAQIDTLKAEHEFIHGRFGEGLPYLWEAADALFDDHKGLNNLGSVAAEYGLNTAASDLYRRALKVWPSYVTPWANLANIAVDEGRLRDAEECLVWGESIDRHHPMILRAREKLERRKRQGSARDNLAQRIRLYREELAKTPNDPVLHNNLGTAYAESGDLSKAAEEWEMAVKLKPDYALPHRNLAVYYEREKHDAAKAEFHKKEYERLAANEKLRDAKEKDATPGLSDEERKKLFPDLPKLPGSPEEDPFAEPTAPKAESVEPATPKIPGESRTDDARKTSGTHGNLPNHSDESAGKDGLLPAPVIPQAPTPPQPPAPPVPQAPTPGAPQNPQPGMP